MVSEERVNKFEKPDSVHSWKRRYAVSLSGYARGRSYSNSPGLVYFAAAGLRQKEPSRGQGTAMPSRR